MERVDLSLELDLDEVAGEIQRRMDRVTAARVELAASLTDLADGREQVLSRSARAVASVDAFMNPLAANPPPLAPEVAAPAPEVEPPVFTTVTEVEATPVNTSGGNAAAVDPTNIIILPETVATPEAHEADPVPEDLAQIVEAGAAAVAAHNERAAETVAAAEQSADPFAEKPAEITQKAPKGDEAEAAAADAANQPGVNGDPVGNTES